MNRTVRNPFDITKATDLSDEQIMTYWVGLLGSTQLENLAKPKSLMPMIILGGKGSGKTHLMRYFSFEAQRVRHGDSLYHGILSDEYVGIYLRLSTLNGNRFQGKGIAEEPWSVVYAYYMELWLAQRLLWTLHQFVSCDACNLDELQAFTSAVVRLFDVAVNDEPRDLPSLIELLANFQREADLEINNCYRTGSLNVVIRSTPGKLVFGIPEVASRHLAPLRNLTFLYLLDELENVTIAQQQYIQTLIRERTDPSSIRVGSRLYGFKTTSTISGEENIENSEYEVLYLDQSLRASSGDYDSFAVDLITNRLGPLGSGLGNGDQRQRLSKCFEAANSARFYHSETKEIVAKYEGKERPYFLKLRESLQVHAAQLRLEVRVIPTLVDLLRVPDFPLLEKLNVFLLYREWFGKEDLIEAAKEIHENCHSAITGTHTGKYLEVYEKFGGDLYSQLRRECDLKQEYLGLETFIHMSQGLPRSLLTILKEIYDWAIFKGETPFGSKPISRSAQREGLLAAADWFFEDSRGPSARGAEVRNAIGRLAVLFRSLRYSDKPPEKSLSSFSAAVSAASERARETIILAEQWSLLVYVDEQRDRNSMRLDRKYQLSSMIAPRWDLPVYRGGSIALNLDEVEAIFGDAGSSYDDVLKSRSQRANAPFGRKENSLIGTLFDGVEP